MAEPVSLEDCKAYLRVNHPDEDDKIAGMITRAREWVEDHTGMALVQREFVERRRPERGAIGLWKAPLVTVDSVTYRDNDDVEQAYEVRWIEGGSVIFPGSGSYWPVLYNQDGFTVTYTAGYEAGEVPERLIGAILTLVQHEYDEHVAWSDRAIEAASRCCGQLRMAVL
jgi:uncharacterized phiE125 gp8 family phage protein